MFNKFYSKNKRKFIDSMQFIIKKSQSDTKLKQYQIEQYLEDAFDSIVAEILNKIKNNNN